jgi:hypothetical protein
MTAIPATAMNEDAMTRMAFPSLTFALGGVSQENS